MPAVLTQIIIHKNFVSDNHLIPVSEALDAVLRTVKAGPVISVVTEDASGYVLAQTVKSPYLSPPFDNSAMDGYAFRFDDHVKGKPILIVGEVPAGKKFKRKLKSGEAVRIFTGAAVPDGADSVVMQERIFLKEDRLLIRDEKIFRGANIRKAGSQLKKGAVAIDKGTFLNSGAIGYLSALGIASVKVFSLPSVAIIVTGDELIAPGRKLLPGQIFESNGATLKSVLQTDILTNIKIFRTKDTFEATRKVFQKAFASFDIVLFSGGISEGDYDFVGKVLTAEKVKTVFYKVKQKPGKPLYFGRKGRKYIFGLPGNPASVLTCYYEYVRPAIRCFQNHSQKNTNTLQLPLTATLNKKPGLTHFLKAFTDFKSVTPLPGQESYIMKSFVEANCFIVLNEATEIINAGEFVDVHLL